MKLPDIKLPAIDLPFDIPTLLHPAVVHFVVAIPVVILLLELYNVFVRRKSLGAFSFILLIITVVMLAVAVLTGTTDGKETFQLLSPEGQAELKEHKLLGIYVLLASVGVLFLRLLAMTGKGFFKFLFLVGLIGFIALTLKQGKEGGELVYEHGANVERVSTLKDDITDLNEELEEAKESSTAKEDVIKKEVAEETKEAVSPSEDAVVTPAATTSVSSAPASTEVEKKTEEVIQEANMTLKTEPAITTETAN